MGPPATAAPSTVTAAAAAPTAARTTLTSAATGLPSCRGAGGVASAAAPATVAIAHPHRRL